MILFSLIEVADKELKSAAVAWAHVLCQEDLHSEFSEASRFHRCKIIRAPSSVVHRHSRQRLISL